MKFCISYLLLALLLGACSNTPIQPNNPVNNQSNQVQQPIVNQAEEAAPEARFSQNLNELMAQVSQTHQIPLSNIEAGFLDAKTIPSIRKLVLPPSATFKKIGWYTVSALLNQSASRLVEPFGIKIRLF